MQVRSLGQKVPLEEGTATHSSILAWRIPWTEEHGGLQPMGSQGVGHNLVTNIFTSYFLDVYNLRHYFANKGPSGQGYGFSSGHVWM